MTLFSAFGKWVQSAEVILSFAFCPDETKCHAMTSVHDGGFVTTSIISCALFVQSFHFGARSGLRPSHVRVKRGCGSSISPSSPSLSEEKSDLFLCAECTAGGRPKNHQSRGDAVDGALEHH